MVQGRGAKVVDVSIAAKWLQPAAVLFLFASLAAWAEAAEAGPLLLGRSELGRPIIVWKRGDAHARNRILVVGCIHGNECAGAAIVTSLEHTALPPDTALWLIPDLNPDGAAARTRGDARGVDLNRNFPWRWQRQEGLFDSGARPLSERESRIAYRLILTYRPTVSIWFHQHANLVDESGGTPAIEERFADRVRLPFRRLPRYPGSVVGWENHVFPTSTAFVVELPSRAPGRSDVRRFAAATVAVAE